MQNYFKISLLTLFSLSTIVSCGINHGQPLNLQSITMITRQQTTEGQIRATFGEPARLRVDLQQGVKILTYHYQNDDKLKRVGATLGGSILGGVLGHQIGGGSGQALATSIGTIAGGTLGGNAVTTREEEQILDVVISLQIGRVIDYRYLETRGRSQRWHFNSGVIPL